MTVNKPWEIWTWKQRLVYSGVMFLVAVGTMLAQGAVSSPGASLAVSLLQILIFVPGLYVLFSSARSVDRRFKAGDDSVHPPRVVAKLRERETRQLTRGEIHKQWFFFTLMLGAFIGVTVGGIQVLTADGDVTWSRWLTVLLVYLVVFLIAGQVGAVVVGARERRKSKDSE